MVPMVWYHGTAVVPYLQISSQVSLFPFFKTLNKNEGGGAFYVFDLNFLSFFVCVSRPHFSKGHASTDAFYCP